MSNQALLWASVVLAWLSAFFLKKGELRRYMPVGLFTMLAFVFIFEAGISFHWWAVNESSYPLINIPAFVFGPYLMGTIWIVKYTYGRFWLFLLTNIVLDYILIFFLIDWFVQRGVWTPYVSYFQILLITTALAVLLYGYHMWQTGEAAIELVPEIKSAAVKPLSKDQDDELE